MLKRIVRNVPSEFVGIFVFFFQIEYVNMSFEV